MTTGLKKEGLWEFTWTTYRTPELVRVLCRETPTSWGIQQPGHAKSQRAKKDKKHDGTETWGDSWASENKVSFHRCLA